MVHALEAVHSHLAPNGLLIDIHPTTDIPPVEVHSGGEIVQVGWLEESSGTIQYQQADDALTAVIARGLFVQGHAQQITVLDHADSVADLRAYLDKNWSDALLADEIVDRIEARFAAAPGPHEIVIRERVHITQLRRL
jgi:hypothetical protein